MKSFLSVPHLACLIGLLQLVNVHSLYSYAILYWNFLRHSHEHTFLWTIVLLLLLWNQLWSLGTVTVDDDCFCTVKIGTVAYKWTWVGKKLINTAQINFLVEFLKFPLMNENNFLFIVSKCLYGACFKNFWTPVRSVIKISQGPDSIKNKNLFRGCHTML